MKMGDATDEARKAVERNLDISHSSLFSNRSAEDLLLVAHELKRFLEGGSLYNRVRACMLLYSIYRFHMKSHCMKKVDVLPYSVMDDIENRRFAGAIRGLDEWTEKNGMSEPACEMLAETYYELAFDALLEQVKLSIARKVGPLMDARNLGDYAMRIPPSMNGKIVRIKAPVRVEVTSGVASDIFFLAMKRWEHAGAINISVDLKDIDGDVKPPIEVFARRLEEPVIRLKSVDLGEERSITNMQDLFDYGSDHLGLLKAGFPSSCVIPYGLAMERLEDVLKKLGGGVELVTYVHNIPRNSGLAVSTMLMAAIVAALMRLTGQAERFDDAEKMEIAARALLGEHTVASGGGWQDVGGMWGGVKAIEGRAGEGGLGDLLPDYKVMDLSEQTKSALMESLVLVMGGTTQSAGPVLRDVTEQYLLRSEKEFRAREDAESVHMSQKKNIMKGDARAIGALEDRDWKNRITIVPLADNEYIDSVNRRLRNEFGAKLYGFDSTGCRGGAGGTYWVDPSARDKFCEAWLKVSSEERARLTGRVPVVVEPLIYDYRINEHGIECGFATERELAEACAHSSIIYGKSLPLDVGVVKCSFNEEDFRKLQYRYKKGEIGLVKNRLRRDEIAFPDATDMAVPLASFEASGLESIRTGELACISPNGGAGTRFMDGAVAKGACPLFLVRGRYRSFAELKIAQNMRARMELGGRIKQGFINSYATDAITRALLEEGKNFGLDEVLLAADSGVMLRVVPSEEDLRYRHSLRKKEHDIKERLETQYLEGWINFYRGKGGEVLDSGGRNPMTKFSPAGHFDVLATLFESGMAARLLESGVKYALVSNIDNLGATIEPALLGMLKASGKPMLVELTARWKDVGGSLVLHNGRKRLLEGIAFPDKESELSNPYFNTATYWIDLPALADALGADVSKLGDREHVRGFLDSLRQRMPVYALLKDSAEEFDHGIIELWPVAQFERLFGDITALVETEYALVDRRKRFFPIKSLDEKRKALESGLDEVLEKTTLFAEETH